MLPDFPTNPPISRSKRLPRPTDGKLLPPFIASHPQGTPFFALPCGRLPAGYPRFPPTLRAFTRRVPPFRPYPAGDAPPFPVGLPPLPYPNNFHPDSLTSLPTNLGHGSIHPHVAPLSPVTGGHFPHVAPLSPITCGHFPHVAPLSPVTGGLASGSGSEKGRSEPGKGEKMRFWSKGGGFEPGMAKRNRGRPSFSTL